MPGFLAYVSSPAEATAGWWLLSLGLSVSLSPYSHSQIGLWDVGESSVLGSSLGISQGPAGCCRAAVVGRGKTSHVPLTSLTPLPGPQSTPLLRDDSGNLLNPFLIWIHLSAAPGLFPPVLLASHVDCPVPSLPAFRESTLW